MKRTLWFTAIVVAVCLTAIYLLAARLGSGLTRGMTGEATVAVGVGEGTYRCSGPGRRVRGVSEVMGECTAIRKGYRPALGIGCGSPCAPGLSAGAMSSRP
jgi:hypothetical protein